MAHTGNLAPAWVRAAIVLFSLRDLDRLAEGIEPSEAAWITDAFRAEVEKAAAEQGAHVRLRSPGKLDLVFEAKRAPSRVALSAVLTAIQVTSRWQEKKEETAHPDLLLPECNAAVHIDDFVSTGQAALLGNGMEIALRIASVARDNSVFVSERTLEYVVAGLPPGWESVREYDDWAPAPEAFVDLLSEDLLPLSDEFEGRVVRIGPEVAGNPGGAVLEFRFWVEAKVPGRNSQFPILRAKGGSSQTLEVWGLDDSMQLAPESENRSDSIRFGRYELLHKIGEGGMGAVWLARDRFGNKVAIKQLLPGRAVSASQLKRFRLEAEVMSRLSHRNIARIHEVGEVDGTTFIAMEYIEGASLAEVLAHTSGEVTDLVTIVATIHRERTSIQEKIERSAEPAATMHRDSKAAPMDEQILENIIFVLPIPQSLALMQKVCEAVHFAHEHGVLHRDLKPHNIMVRPDGEPVIMDFGLAKLQQDKAHVLSLSLSGQILGTFGYMAPEQAADSKRVTERADVYALGAILYEMLTGWRAFRPTGNLAEDVDRLRDHVPTTPRRLNKLVERDLEIVTLKALRPEPEQRYSSARLFGDDLGRFAAGEPILARKPTLRYRLGKHIRKNRTAFTAALLILVLSIAFGVYAWTNYQKQWGRWVKIYGKDFTVSGATLDDFEVRDTLGIHLASAAPPERDGLSLEAFTHYWLRNVRVAGSVRVVAEFTVTDPSGNIGVFLNAAPSPLA